MIRHIVAQLSIPNEAHAWEFLEQKAGSARVSCSRIRVSNHTAAG